MEGPIHLDDDAECFAASKAKTTTDTLKEFRWKYSNNLVSQPTGVLLDVLAELVLATNPKGQGLLIVLAWHANFESCSVDCNYSAFSICVFVQKFLKFMKFPNFLKIHQNCTKTAKTQQKRAKTTRIRFLFPNSEWRSFPGSSRVFPKLPRFCRIFLSLP